MSVNTLRRLNQVFSESEFSGATLLRLGPYSPMLNPIENVWSATKAHVRRLLHSRSNELYSTSEEAGVTLAEHRTRYLESIAEEAMGNIASQRNLISSCCAHISAHYEDIMLLRDVRCGC